MEPDGEIEYLDEDAEIVQQCVHVPVNIINLIDPDEDDDDAKPLLVERVSERRRKRKKEEDDSDYDPSNDITVRSPEPSKRKRQNTRKNTKVRMTSPGTRLLKVSVSTPVRTYKSYSPAIKARTVPLKPPINRNKMHIRIPDYEDPLCMPVRALHRVSSDLQRLKNWNNACLEHFKQCDTILKPEIGRTKSSTRTIVLRNVVHKETGKSETAVWSKTCVENKEGVKKSEIFQSILPKYREKKVLRPYNLQSYKRHNRVFHYEDVLLTKEDDKDGELLVVYKPKESLSAVYKLGKESVKQPFEEEPKRVLREVACCKVCAPCYQMSWRGSTERGTSKKTQCPVCERTMVSVYNFLTHLKGHSKMQIQKFKRAISVILAGVLDYHYKCRVCQEQFLSIKTLRRHVATHKGTIPFRCEIGDHMTS